MKLTVAQLRSIINEAYDDDRNATSRSSRSSVPEQVMKSVVNAAAETWQKLYSLNSSTITADGESAWRVQVEAASKTLFERVNELVGAIERDLLHGGYDYLVEESVLKEDYLHGVSEWELRQDTSEFVDQIRDRIKRYILLNKSENPADQREAIAAMNNVCDDLEEKVYEVLEDALYNFTRSV